MTSTDRARKWIFIIDARDMMRKGHDFRDYICPDFIEKHSDYLILGDKFARVLYLKDYANYIKDSFISELTDLNRNMMLSLDIVPIPMDEAVREIEKSTAWCGNQYYQLAAPPEHKQ